MKNLINTILFNILMITLIIYLYISYIPLAMAYTANKVWMEIRHNNKYRVYINYTIPALKEMREAYVDFDNKKEAEKFYFDLIKGADFFPSDYKNTKYINQTSAPDPW